MGDKVEPLVLRVNTAVSAKFKGAFCEAKVKHVSRSIKYRVMMKKESRQVFVDESEIEPIGGGSLNSLRQSDTATAVVDKKSVEVIIKQILDNSIYRVLFNDGDEKELRRTQLVPMGNKHYMTGESLDELPLTKPEQFSSPVANKRSNTSLQESMVGQVVCLDIEAARGATRPFIACPFLVVRPTDSAVANNANLLMLRSFKDNKIVTADRHDVKTFSTYVMSEVADDDVMRPAFERAKTYWDSDVLPASWDRCELFGEEAAPVRNSDSATADGSSAAGGGDFSTIVDEVEEEDESSIEESSDEEDATGASQLQNDAKDYFIAQLFKYMDDRGTPLNCIPAISGHDLDLYRLFKLVWRYGGFNKVIKNDKWWYLYRRLMLPPDAKTTAKSKLMQAYKKWLHPFEDFYKKFGSGMGVLVRSLKKHRFVTPKPSATSLTSSQSATKVAVTPAVTKPSPSKRAAASEPPPKPDEKRLKRELTLSPSKRKRHDSATLTLSSAQATDATPSETPKQKQRHVSAKTSSSASAITDEKRLLSSKVMTVTAAASTGDVRRIAQINTTLQQRRRITSPPSSSSATFSDRSIPLHRAMHPLNTGTKLDVRYGEDDLVEIYSAKIIYYKYDEDDVLHYRVHYAGWNPRYDEWITKERILKIVKMGQQPPEEYQERSERGVQSESSSSISSDTARSPSRDESKSPMALPKPTDAVASPPMNSPPTGAATPDTSLLDVSSSGTEQAKTDTKNNKSTKPPNISKKAEHMSLAKLGRKRIQHEVDEMLKSPLRDEFELRLDERHSKAFVDYSQVESMDRFGDRESWYLRQMRELCEIYRRSKDRYGEVLRAQRRWLSKQNESEESAARTDPNV